MTAVLWMIEDMDTLAAAVEGLLHLALVTCPAALVHLQGCDQTSSKAVATLAHLRRPDLENALADRVCAKLCENDPQLLPAHVTI